MVERPFKECRFGACRRFERRQLATRKEGISDQDDHNIAQSGVGVETLLIVFSRATLHMYSISECSARQRRTLFLSPQFGSTKLW